MSDPSAADSSDRVTRLLAATDPWFGFGEDKIEYKTVQSAGLAWVFPLTFASSAFVPTDSMPAAVAAFANVNPITLCVDAARALMIGGDATVPLLGTLAWFVGLMAVFAPLAIRRYRTLA